MNKTRHRVSYLPMPEMQFEYFKDRIAEVLKAFYPDFSFTSICDAIECYEIMRYRGCSNADEWFSSNNYDADICNTRIKAQMCKLITSSQSQVLIDACLSMDVFMAKAFLRVISDYSLFGSFDGNCLSSILSERPYFLTDVLHLEKMVKKFKNQIRKQMLEQIDSAECILDRFVGKEDSHSSPIYLPESLTEDDINAILLNYLNSGKANWNYVNYICHSRPEGIFKPSIEVMVVANAFKKNNNPFKNPKAPLIGIKQHQISLLYKKDEYVLEEQIDDNGSIRQYQIGVLKDCSADLAIHAAVSTFEIVSRENILELVRKRGYCSDYEYLANYGKHDYVVTPHFDKINKQALARFIAYSAALQELNGKSIEQYIQDFYGVYIRDTYNYEGKAICFASKDDTALIKAQSAAPLIEGILKDYCVYHGKGYVDMSYRPHVHLPKYSEIGSPIPKKYATLAGYNEDFESISQLLFSDLSSLNYKDDSRLEYDNFYQRVLYDDVSEAELDNNQKRITDTLKNNGFLILDEEGFLRIRDKEFVSLLYDLYRNGTVSYWYYPAQLRCVIDHLVENGVLRYQSTLFTSEEASYFSFLLKDDSYKNGPSLRNKYAHDEFSGDPDDNLVSVEYSKILLIIVMILIKIEDDLNIAKVLKQTEGDSFLTFKIL